MGYEFGFSGQNMAEGIATGAMGIVAGVFVIFALLMMAFGVVAYVLGSLGTYRIAKRRGIHHAWLAWIPVGNYWLTGSISDHYQYVVKQKLTNRRRILLILGAVITGFALVSAGVGIYSTLTVRNAVTGTMGMMALVTVLYVIYLGVGIAATVYLYIAYYDLFRSCKPGYAVLFLVLSILFNVTLPFFVFACSGFDQGMPERRANRPVSQISDELCVPRELQEQEPTAVQEEAIPVVEAELVQTDATEQD